MTLKNTYYLLRHGEAISNVKQIVSSWPEELKNPLTIMGRKQVREAARKLKNKGISLIFSSDLLRTQQTADIVGRTLKIKPKFDKRLREISFGGLNGRPAEELLYLSFEKDRIKHSFQKSETYKNVLERVWDFFAEINRKYKNKNILVISHQCPLWILENRIKGLPLEEGLERVPKHKRIGRGEIRELN